MIAKAKRTRRHLFLEPLEDRRLLATFTVNSMGNEGDDDPDDGKCLTAAPISSCTLRAAADQAANDPSDDRIEFNIDVPEGVIPTIDRSISAGNGTLVIDGTTQPGSGMVEIIDSTIVLADGGGHTVKGLVLTNSRIRIFGDNNTVVGNIIGLDPSGAPNGNPIGIEITGSDNRIGGTTPAERNVISGNGTGIHIRSAAGLASNNNIIIGNFIGTNVDGTTADPDGTPGNGDETGNVQGIEIDSGNGNRIGGPTEAERNVISGNTDNGIRRRRLPSDNVTVENTVIQGNFIGTDVTGAVALGNRGRGIELTIASNTTIADNVIAANTMGILLGSDTTTTTVTGNKIGTDVTGSVTDPDGTPGNGDELGNRDFGIRLRPFFADTVTTGNTIGGPEPEDRNVIAGNDIGVSLFNGADSNIVQGNYIGTSSTGTVALPNREGVEVLFSNKNAIIGNTISGNTTGIEIGGSTGTDNLVAGNHIGTNAQGTAPLGNEVGILINDSPGNCIGGFLPISETAMTLCAGGVPGTQTMTGNLISGNLTYGVQIANPNAANNVVQANKIGTDVTGMIADPDGTAGSGDELGNVFDGVFLSQGAHDNTIGGTTGSRRNLISGNLGDGILITGTSANPVIDNTVLGNYVGTDMTGNAALPNLARGIHIDQHSEGNIIGGETPNVISGNALDGIVIALPTATDNVVFGNRIGTNVNDTDRVSNGANGIFIFNAPVNRIGGFDDGTSTIFNVISGNEESGIRIEGANASGNLVGANLIGVDRTGSQRRRNLSDGIRIVDAPDNRIGAPLSGDQVISGNVISGNTEHGIRIEGETATGNVVGGNKIGTDAQGKVSATLSNARGVFINHASGNFIGGLVPDGSADGTELPANLIAGNGLSGVEIQGDTATNNRIQKNSIFSNGFGIDLGGNGITPNDDMDEDGAGPPPSLPNTLQNFPILDNQIDEDGTISGTLNSRPNTEYAIDFYLSKSENRQGFVEGEQWVDRITETTDSDGIVFFEFQIPRALLAVRDKITATATDPNGNTSEFSAPILLADLRVTLDEVDVGDIVRRGAEFFLPYKAKVFNFGTLAAEDAVVRIEGNGELVIDEPHVVTLEKCIDPNVPDSCPNEEFTGEWNITDLFAQGVQGAPVTLTLVIKADPDKLIPELAEDNNETIPAPFDADPRPRIDLVESEFKFGGFHLNGVSLDNKFDLTVDWNGNLDNSQIGLDQLPVVKVFVNGSQKDSHQVTDLSAKAPLTIDLGNDLARGLNELIFRADTDLHFFFSDFTEPNEFRLGDTVDWINTALWAAAAKTPSTTYDNIAEYSAGIRFPQVSTEAFFGVPVDAVGFAGGDLGPIIPKATLRGKLYSDKTGTIEGELKWEGKVGGKKVVGVGGSIEGGAEGAFEVVGNDLDLKRLTVNVEIKGFVQSPKVPFPPPASFIRAQAQIGLDVGLIVEVIDDEDGEKLNWSDDAILTFQPNISATIGIGEDGIASVEVTIGGNFRAEYELDGKPCLEKSVAISPFARLRATFLGFEAQKTFTFSWTKGCGGAGGEGEGFLIDPLVFDEIGLLPRFVFDTTGVEAESASMGLPTVVYPYAKPALARNDDGTMTLVYVSEDPTKADGQHLEIFASRYDGSEWSAPVQLTDDTLLDDSPSVVYDSSGQAVASWARLKNTVADPANTDPTTLLGDFEIVYAVYDPTSESWSAPAALTDDAEMDFLPQLQTDAAGRLTAMWLRDAGNDTPVFPDDPTPLSADYVYSTWDGTSWSAPAAAATVSTNRVPQFTFGDGNGVLVWSEDIDGDATLDTDTEIRTSIWDGTSWAVPTVLGGAGDGIADLAPRVAYDSAGRGNVIWVKAGVPLSEAENDSADQLYFTEFTGGSFSTPIQVLETEGISDPNLIIDNDDNPIVVWQGLSDTGPDIFFATLDRASGAWSEPIQFTDSESLEWWFNPFINDDGELEIIYLEREVGSEPLPADDGSGAEGEPGDEMIPTFISSSLATSSQPLGHDLSVTQLILADPNPTAGSVVQLTATIVNSGTVTAPAAELAFFDEGAAIGLLEALPELNAGETTVVTIDWTVPQDAVSTHVLSARVDPNDQLVEIDETNNEASLVALQPDLVASVLSSLDSDTITVTATISNQGASPTSGPFDVALRQDDADSGASLGTQTVNDILAPGESTTLTFTIPDAVATLGGFHTGFIVADSGSAIEEADETNNVDFAALDPLVSIASELPVGAGPFTVHRDNIDVVVTQQDSSELVREQLSVISHLTLPATAGDDQVTIDFSTGNPIPVGGLFFSGADGDDSLLLQGGGVRDITFRGGAGTNSLVLLSAGIQLDLTDPAQNLLTGVDVIDITGDGDNGITLNLQKVRDVTPASDELMLHADIGDTVAIANGWALTRTEIAGGNFFRVLEQDGARLLLAGPADWQNPIDELDVNNDGSRSPVDALIIINDLNRAQSPFRGSTSQALDPFDLNSDNNPNNDFDSLYRDTNGDGFFSPLDVLLVFNFLNSPGSNLEGEGIAPYLTGSSENQRFATELVVAGTDIPALFGGTSPDDRVWQSAAIDSVSASPRRDYAAAVDELANDDQLVDLLLTIPL